MRCPDCNKFVSYGEQEPELDIQDIRNDTVTVEVRVVLPCADCNTELKDYSESVEIDLSQEFDFDLRPIVSWGDVKIFTDEYFVRRAQCPDTLEWIITIFRVSRPWVSGPRDQHGRPDYQSDKAVHGMERKWLSEIIIQPSPTALNDCDDAFKEWALALWTKERFEIEEDGNEFFQDSKGSGRYTQTFYGADFKIKVTDKATEKEHIFECHVQEQASSFNECC